MDRQQDPNTDFEARLLAQLKGVVAEREAEAARGEAAEVVAPTPAWRRRGPRLAMGGGVALAALAAALVVSAGGDNTPAAYAVEPQPGGGVKLQIFNLGDPEGVEQALEEAGIDSQVNYLEAGMTCREPHYQPSMALMRTLQEHQPQPQPWAGFNYESDDGPLTIAIGDYEQRRQMDEDLHEAYRQGDRDFSDAPSFVIYPDSLGPDQTLVMTSAPTPEGYEQPIPPKVDGVEYFPGKAQIDTVGQVRVAEGEVAPCEPVPAPAGEAAIRAPEGGWDFGDTPYAGWGFGAGPGRAK
jgi:hypothetical protein